MEPPKNQILDIRYYTYRDIHTIRATGILRNQTKSTEDTIVIKVNKNSPWI